MSLRYTRYEDLCLKAGSKITLNALNDAFRKLVENDNSLIPENSIVPKIWECKWFNDSSIEGYSKGEAVWVNTEPLDEFTSAHYQTILNYLLENAFYRPKVEALLKENDVSKLFAMCKSMVADGKVFYVGSLAKPVQLKISVADDNKDVPLDTSAKWKDFFVLTDDSTNMHKFQQILTQQTQQLLDLHVKTYHLPESFPVEDYLLRDMSNIDQSKLQRCKSTKYRSNMQGFDYVLLSVRKKYAGKTEKWFRMWSSGYLEHGGIVDLSASLPDGDEKTGCMYTVNLGWKYGKDKKQTAPTYEYQPVDFRDMYCTALSSDFDVDGEDEAVEYDLKDMVSVKTRYVVSLTPCTSSSAFAYSQPPSSPQKLDLYETNAVCALDNSSFMFFFQSNNGHLRSQCYTYYCSGFSTTMFDRVRKQTEEVQEQTLACECR